MKEICVGMVTNMVIRIEFRISNDNMSNKENLDYIMGSYHTINGAVRELRDNLELSEDEFDEVCDIIDDATERLLDLI